MTHSSAPSSVLTITFAVAVAVMSGCSAGPGASLPSDGAGLVAAACSTCHAIQRVETAKKDRNGWIQTISRMQAHGLTIDETQRQTIIDYLAQRDGGQ